MKREPEHGAPLRQFAAERRASGNKLLRPTSHPSTHFRKNEPIGDLPGDRRRTGTRQCLAAVSAPYRECPAIDSALRKAQSLEDHLLANLFVNARHRNKDVGPHFL